MAKENLIELGLDHYSLNDIQKMKKNKFKTLVRSACQDTSFRDLKSEIREKNLTKLQNISYTKFEMQKYLLTSDLTTSLKKVVFKARTGMLPIGFNFGEKNTCFACQISDDTDRHLLECVVLKMASPDLMENTESVFNDVYSSEMIKVAKVSKLLRSALRARAILKNN